MLVVTHYKCLTNYYIAVNIFLSNCENKFTKQNTNTSRKEKKMSEKHRGRPALGKKLLAVRLMPDIYTRIYETQGGAKLNRHVENLIQVGLKQLDKKAVRAAARAESKVVNV